MLCEGYSNRRYYSELGFETLTEVQQKILDKRKNVLILSSCGSGKTEASYFNLIDDGKLIFVQPMKTLANSIRDRLNEYNQKLGLDTVTIQHSGNQEDRFLQNKYSVTTIDQVLSGYLALGKQAFMRGKNVVCSNLIFDEVQLFDTDTMLLTTINMLDEVNKLGNRFIIMTATMPTFLIEFLKNRYDMEVIITEEERTDREVKIHYIDNLDYTTINDHDDKQIIICNTIDQLINIYEHLDKERLIVLHSRFTSSDRALKEQEVIKYFGKHSEPNNKILLTTQIVEAGMDISADVLYSALCSIDSLVQRDGRCCRWGGNGEVIVFNSDDFVYDKEVVQDTKSKLIHNNGAVFNWKRQKEWINDILNPFYQSKITDNNILKNKKEFKSCDRNKLIRCVKNVNLIVSDTKEKEDFNRETVSISLSKLKEVAEHNDLYILNKNNIDKVSHYSVDIGETVLIEGHNCIYDELGFRIQEDIKCNPFKMQNNIHKVKYDDYIEETWLDHAESVKDLFAYKLRIDKFNTYTIDNLKKIAFYGGLHDIGKLDKEWQKKCSSPKIPLAHFPFVYGAKGDMRRHDRIGAYALKDVIQDKIIFNMILQHHRKFSTIENNIQSTGSSWCLCNNAKDILKEYGLELDIIYDSEEKAISSKDIITPKNEEWTTLLYLTGLLMETEIQAISENINNYKNKLKRCDINEKDF